jgi:hypothetical protein
VFADHPWLGRFVDAPAWFPAVVLGAGMLAAGVMPRSASGLLLALLLPASAHAGRYPGRVLLWNVVLCLAFLRSDGAFSIRRLIRSTPIQPSPAWPIRMMQLSVSLLYAVNVAAKLNPDFLSGRVLSLMSMELSNFRVRITDVLPLPFGLSIPVSLCAIGTVMAEAVLAVGWWLPVNRRVVAAIGIAFHLAVKYVVSVAWLDWLAMSLYLVFLLPLTDGPLNANVPAPVARVRPIRAGARRSG